MGMWMGVAKETGDTGHKSGASSDGHLHNYQKQLNVHKLYTGQHTGEPLFTLLPGWDRGWG